MEPNFQLVESHCVAKDKGVMSLEQIKHCSWFLFDNSLSTQLIPYLYPYGPAFHIVKDCSVSCLAQVAESPDGQEVSTEVAPVPPFAYGVQGLKHSTNYSVRVQCSNEMGSSPFTERVYFQTLELGKQIAMSL